MNKRRWFHTDTVVGGTTLDAHVSEWLGFAQVKQLAQVQADQACVVRVDATNLVAEGLIIRAL